MNALLWLASALVGCPSAQGTKPPQDMPHPPLPPDSVVQTILVQGVLDHPRVAPYLHTEIAANLPLTLYAPPDLADGLGAVTAAGQPIRAMPSPDQARVRLSARVQLEGPRVRIPFTIPAEGVRGHVDLELSDYVWHPIDAVVIEQ